MQQSNRGALLTVDQAADRLGLSVATMRAWVWRRKIEHVKLGRAVRIPEGVVNAIVERGTVPAARSVA